jgi:hypothetical protein
VSEAQRTIAERLRWQAGWCARLGSALYAGLLEAAAADTERGGPAWALLAGTEREPVRGFLPLRLLGSVHRLVLMGRLPDLAAVYPSAGGKVDLARAPALFLAALEDHAGEVRAHLDRPVQTNEVSRSAGLLGGFLLIARETGMPLALHEAGASAGLNLRFDRYRYVSGDWSWGDPRSPVRFEHVFADATPPAGIDLQVAARLASDRNPLDPRAEEDRLTLMSFVWPDQGDRFERLRAALVLAREDDVEVERAGAAEWAERVLAEPRPGIATVFYHSIVVQYLSAEDGARLHEAILAAGERATPAAPVAWLFLEPGEEEADVRLTVWPGGEERMIARAGFQGGPVRWLARDGS